MAALPIEPLTSGAARPMASVTVTATEAWLASTPASRATPSAVEFQRLEASRTFTAAAHTAALMAAAVAWPTARPAAIATVAATAPPTASAGMFVRRRGPVLTRIDQRVPDAGHNTTPMASAPPAAMIHPAALTGHAR